MRPLIKSSDLIESQSVAVTVFEAIAELKHYKVLYLIQKANRANIHGALGEIFKNKELMEAGTAWANLDENYNNVFKELIANYCDFIDTTIPTRDCDFKVTHDNEHSITYFWIDERIEICYDSAEYYIAQLIVDERSNVLHYDLRNDERVGTYSESEKVGKAYKSFLAERELLK